MLDCYNNNRSDITVCGMMNTTNGEDLRWKNIPPEGVFYNEDKLDLLFSVQVECHSPYRLYHRKLFFEYHLWFNENAYYEDTALMPRLFYVSNSVSCVPKILYYYRYNIKSIVNTSSKKHIEDINLAWEGILKHIPLNVQGTKFFWWMYAHNIFRKRFEHLKNEPWESLIYFFETFFKILNQYPFLLENQIGNKDILEIIERMELLSINHSIKTDSIRHFVDLKQYVKPSNIYISVIMPVYNTEKYVLEAIKTVLNQTYEFFELIIVNDASTDNTKKLLDEINDCRVKVIHLPVNSGTYFCRNFGMLMARGEIITTVDSDDLITPDRLKKFADLFLKYPDVNLIEDRFIRFHDDFTLDYRLFTQGVGTGFFRKKVLHDIGYFMPVQGGGDSEFSGRIRTYYGEKSALLLNDFTYCARQRRTSLTNVNPQGSSSREEFISFYKTLHQSKVFIDFPWKKNNRITEQVKQLQIGQKQHLDFIQNITIKQYRLSEIKSDFSRDDDSFSVFYKFLSQGIGYYYGEYEKYKHKMSTLQNKLDSLEKEKSDLIHQVVKYQNEISLYKEMQEKDQLIFMEKLSDHTRNNFHLKIELEDLKKQKQWYRQTYEHLPKLYLKIGSVFRLTQKKE